MTDIEKLQTGGGGWVSKAMAGVDDRDLGQELAKINNMIQQGMRHYRDNNYPSAVANIGDAKRKLEDLRRHTA